MASLYAVFRVNRLFVLGFAACGFVLDGARRLYGSDAFAGELADLLGDVKFLPFRHNSTLPEVLSRPANPL